MSVINHTDLKAVDIAFETLSIDFLSRARLSPLMQLFTDFGSTDQLMTRIHLLETMPLMRQWLGDVTYEDVRYSSVSAEVKAYKKALELPRLQVASLRAAGLMQQIERVFSGPTVEGEYERIATDYLLSNPTGYDGVSLFSGSHPRGPAGATQSNTSSTALDLAQHRAVMSAGSQLRDANGEPWAIQYDTLMVGPALAQTAREVTGSDVGRVVGINASGAETGTRIAASTIRNVAGLKIFDGGEVTVVVNPRFVGTHANKYVYLDTTKGVSPIAMRVYDERAIAMTADDSPERAKRDVYQWAVEADLSLLPAAWQVAYLGAP